MQQLIPVFRQIDAVYWDQTGTEEIFRLSIVGIMKERETAEYRLAEADGDGFIEPIRGTLDEDFLGLEFDGKKYDWTKKIERIKDEKKEKK